MEKKIEMFQALMKTQSGGYMAVLSDNSIDRDGEIVGTKALEKVARLQVGKVPILLNHENKIENLVGEWIDRRMEDRNGHTAFVAEPKFYMSNPKAKFIKGLLDDGAECGISIGAIVKDSTIEKINGKDVNVYTDIELLEASFVAIPSNRHGAAMAVAKSFKTKMEASKMDEQMKKDFELKVEDLNKSIVEKDSKIEELAKEVETLKEKACEDDKKKEEDDKKKEEEKKSFEDKIAELNKEIAKLNAEPVNKGELEPTEPEPTEEEKKALEIQEAKQKGYMPIMRG